jgi:hypothetical protein
MIRLLSAPQDDVHKYRGDAALCLFPGTDHFSIRTHGATRRQLSMRRIGPDASRSPASSAARTLALCEVAEIRIAIGAL